METRTVGGNVIEIEEPKAPERPLFELFVQERQAALEVQADTRLIPRDALSGRLGDRR